MSDRETAKKYLDENVSYIMKKMLVDILKKKPTNICDFIIEWT